MKINPVSFGKTVKVLASRETALQIAQAANGKLSLSPENIKNVKEIFNDTEKGRAIAFSLGDAFGNYIFSGKESKEYENMYFKYHLIKKRTESEKSKDNNKKLKEIQDVYFRKILYLIKKTQEPFSLIHNKLNDKIEKTYIV